MTVGLRRAHPNYVTTLRLSRLHLFTNSIETWTRQPKTSRSLRLIIKSNFVGQRYKTFLKAICQFRRKLCTHLIKSILNAHMNCRSLGVQEKMPDIDDLT